MKSSNPSNSSGLEDKTFLLVIAVMSLVFARILWPFFGAILWAVVLAVVFSPVCRRLSKSLWQKRTLGALATLTIIVLMVLLPLALITTSLVTAAIGINDRIQSGELNFGRYFQHVLDSLPDWAAHLLDRFGLSDLGAVQERLAAALTKGSQAILARAFNIGQNTFSFILSLGIMLYLLFFLLRDGDNLARRIQDAVPLRAEQKDALFNKFVVVIRATVKGTVVVALLQGALGGVIFWFLGIHAALLWAVLMAIVSLIPGVGAALIWFPVAIYLLVTGAVWQGVVLIAYGMFVIGLVDNFVRPMLVGKDTKMPDYIVLISTLGGIAVFGPNGFVIGPVIAAMFMAAWEIFSPPK